jgi:hypothetical protein
MSDALITYKFDQLKIKLCYSCTHLLQALILFRISAVQAVDELEGRIEKMRLTLRMNAYVVIDEY